MRSCIFILFALLFNSTQAATNVGSVLLQNTVWTSAGSANPYNLISDVQIPRNVTLTIQSGVRINFGLGNFEIFVKGFLNVHGTASQPVIFEGGSTSDSKWMINFQSTRLSSSSITNAQFTGPKKAIQLANAANGLQQNTDILLIQSSKFTGDTEISANGNYPRNSFPSVPSIEIRLSSLFQVKVSSINTNSEPIRLINTTIYYGTFIPRAANEGVQIINCVVRNTTVNYDASSGSSQVQFVDSNVMNTTLYFQNAWYLQLTVTVLRSVIRDFAIIFTGSSYNVQPNLVFADSSMYNVSTSYMTDYPWYYYSSLSLSIRNCKFTLGNLTTSSYYSSNSIFIQNSVLTKVNISSTFQNSDNNYASRQFTMRNVSFTDGTISLPLTQADISYSTITLIAPPLSINGNSRILCSSIGRSGLISQPNTIGIKATGLILTSSTIKNFDVGLQVTPPYLDTVTISKTNFYSNTKYNIDNIGPYNVTATGVYWGTNNAGVIIAKINDYWDDIHFGEVLYTNFSPNTLPAESGCPAYAPNSYDFTTGSPYSWGK